MRTWLLKKLGARVEGLNAAEREVCAFYIEDAAQALEEYAKLSLAPGEVRTKAQFLRSTGLQLIDAASRPYAVTPDGR